MKARLFAAPRGYERMSLFSSYQVKQSLETLLSNVLVAKKITNDSPTSLVPKTSL